MSRLWSPLSPESRGLQPCPPFVSFLRVAFCNSWVRLSLVCGHLLLPKAGICGRGRLCFVCWGVAVAGSGCGRADQQCRGHRESTHGTLLVIGSRPGSRHCLGQHERRYRTSISCALTIYRAIQDAYPRIHRTKSRHASTKAIPALRIPRRSSMQPRHLLNSAARYSCTLGGEHERRIKFPIVSFFGSTPLRPL